MTRGSGWTLPCAGAVSLEFAILILYSPSSSSSSGATHACFFREICSRCTQQVAHMLHCLVLSCIAVIPIVITPPPQISLFHSPSQALSRQHCHNCPSAHRLTQTRYHQYKLKKILGNTNETHSRRYKFTTNPFLPIFRPPKLRQL